MSRAPHYALDARWGKKLGDATLADSLFLDGLSDPMLGIGMGIGFPALETRFRDRHALVVVRGPGHKRDLRIVRPYVRDFRPVLVAVAVEIGRASGRERVSNYV